MNCMQTARSYRTRTLAVAVLLCGMLWLGVGSGASSFALAQNTQRSVQGRVVTGDDTPVRSAIVYLSDTRTKAVESYITQDDGAFRFEQMSPDDDYKLWAQIGGKRSKTRTLSSFDDRSVFHFILKIPAAK